jgi:two-component system, chemotaxis family, chemotaxis protein CheY
VPGDRPKILVVEDSPMMARLYRVVLHGYDLHFAADGSEALDLAAVEPDADLLIVDVNMPRMDGLEFIRRLRTELGMDDVPVIVCSTETREEDRRAAREAGGSGFLPKPWTPRELLDAVAQHLPENA